MKDYYKILGVDKNASKDEIKKAFRVLAQKYHPDKKGGDEKKFKEINEAYQVLSNDKKRQQYDTYGSAFNGGGGQGFGGFDPFSSGSGFGDAFGGMNFDIDLGDIFGSFFGGGGPKKNRTAGNDIEMLLSINLEDVYNGFKKDISFRSQVKCEKCDGYGYDKKEGTEKCSKCDGDGKIKEQKRTILGNIVQARECDKCFGTGHAPKKVCKTCNGTGRNMGKKTVSVDIPAGAYDGQIIKIPGEGEVGIRNDKNGDLYIRIQVLPHKDFKVQGNNLIVDKEVKLGDVVAGDSVKVKHINGKEISVDIPSGHDIREDIVVNGEGMPYHIRNIGVVKDKMGDLIVRLHLITPKKMSKKAKELADELKKELEK